MKIASIIALVILTIFVFDYMAIRQTSNTATKNESI